MTALCGTAKFEITLDPCHPFLTNFPKGGGMIEVHLAVKLAGEILVNMINGIVKGSIMLEEAEKIDTDSGPRWVVSFSFSIPSVPVSEVLSAFQPANQRRTKRITLESDGSFVSLKDMVQVLGILDAHSKHGLLLDTNLLVVMVWGALGMPRTRVTDAYTAEDLTLLRVLLARNSGQLLTTSHVLAETSNLVAGALSGEMRRAALLYLRTLVLEVLDEAPISGRQAVEDPVFLELGMADAGIAVLRSRKCVVLTADGPLYQRLAALQVPVLNFNHCRGYLLS